MEPAGSQPVSGGPLVEGSNWVLPSSDEEDEADIILLPAGSLNFSRTHWMRRSLAAFEEYCVCFIVPAMCVFAIYALTMDRYASETLMLSANSSLLLQPSPFLVNALEVQVIGKKQGPQLYGFIASPDLGSLVSWSESHDMVVESDQLEAVALWLNEGSLLNITCAIKQPGLYNVIVKILQERKSTRDWVQDYQQASELECKQDETLTYTVPTDGNYSLVLERSESRSMEVVLAFGVVATLYDTNTAVYLCIPSVEPCQLQISFFGNRAAVLSTPNYPQGTFWKAKLSYRVRWFSLASALGCAFFTVAAFLKVASPFYLRNLGATRGEETVEQDEEVDWGVYEDLSEEGDTSAERALCLLCKSPSKDSFFLPCGHSATCLPCGQRLKDEERGCCPMCKTPIEMVNQMFCV